ncbi:DUF3343 domain-containing protein [Carboxydocella thermautotrophica]|uniref:DUF3343 domain-containing protein n=1 Tax=Carboxydocella thermautotrophica TaxID=178899 RepID=UPI003D7CB0DE
MVFSSAQQALAAEHIVDTRALPALIIPTPRIITASCGLSLKCRLEDEATVTAVLRAEGIEPEACYICTEGQLPVLKWKGT